MVIESSRLLLQSTEHYHRRNNTTQYQYTHQQPSLNSSVCCGHPLSLLSADREGGEADRALPLFDVYQRLAAQTKTCSIVLYIFQYGLSKNLKVHRKYSK